MPTLRERQTSFAAGEWAPELYRRTDLQRYHSACRTLLNFFVSQYGTLISRPGSQHLRTFSNELDTGVVWPFIATDGSVWLIVVAGGDASSSIEIASVDAAGDLTWHTGMPHSWGSTRITELQHSQAGDVLRITHPAYAPRLLSVSKSGSAYTWTLERAEFDLEEFDASWGTPRLRDSYGTGATAWRYKVTRVMERTDGSVYESAASDVIEKGHPYASVWDADTTYTVGARVWLDGEDGYEYHANVPHKGISPESGATTTQWTHVAVSGDPSWGEDNVADKGSCLQNVAPSYSNPVRVWWDEDYPWDEHEHGDDTTIATRIYRGVEGRFGFVGQTEENEFWDHGDTPDWTAPPPEGTNPFLTVTHEGKQIDGETNYPRVSEYFESRIIYAGGNTRPSEVSGSATSLFSDFDMVVPANDADAFRFSLAGRFAEDIRALIARQHLIILTSHSEWLVAGSGEAAVITPNSIAARPLSRWGCAELAPLEVNDHVFFLQAKATIPRVILFGPNGRVEGVRDVSQEWRHLFTGHTIVDWTFAEDPYSVVWAARDDGALLSCAFNPLQQMLAWSRHELADGDVKALCALPVGTEDLVYMLVDYGDGLLRLERLASRVIDSIEDAVCVDHSVTYDGRNDDEDITAQVDGHAPVMLGGSSSELQTSPDGETWTAQAANPITTVKGIAHNGRVWVAAGNSGEIATSVDDGVHWTSQTAAGGFVGHFDAIAYGNGLFVAVGTSGEIQTSPDGETWTARDAASTARLKGVVWTGTQFVAVGIETIQTSPDAINWTAQTMADPTKTLNGVGADAGVVVAVGNGGHVETSPDGETWTSRTSGLSNDLQGAAYGVAVNGTGYWVICGDSGDVAASSDEGETWSVRTPANAEDFYAVTFENLTWVMAGTNGEIETSTNGGFTWTQQTQAGGFSGDFYAAHRCALRAAKWEECDVTMVGEAVAGENENSIVRVWDSTGNMVDVHLESHDGSGVYTARIWSYLPAALDGEALDTWAVLSDQVTGLDHLEGLTVYGLADGNVVGPFVVDGAAMTLPELAAVAHVGRSYNCDFYALDFAQERGRKKVVTYVTIETYGARGGYVGINADSLVELRDRLVSHAYGNMPLLDQEHRVAIPSSWSDNAPVMYRQSDPLPVTIVGLAREVEVGG